MLRRIVIGLCCVAVVMSMTTTKAPHHHTTRTHHHTGNHQHTGNHHTTRSHTHTGPTIEPQEHERFRFIYEPHSHRMLVVTGKVTGQSCYLFDLSDSERAGIHTDAGIRAVELKLLSTLSTVAVHEVTKDMLGASTARACGHVAHYYKQSVTK